MKTNALSLISFASAVVALPASADVIYSNLQDITIPADFEGVYLNVETGAWNTDIDNPQSGWDVNPFFGGSVVWNSPTFQPVRSGTSETSAIVNLAAGTSVNSGSTYSTFVQGPNGIDPNGPGYGISETHMGGGAGQFTSSTIGYMGFRLNGGNYGWMRVVFDSSGTGTIKEWAYDDGGAGIAVGNITKTGSVVTADSTYGNFTVASVVADVGGASSFVKTGSGTVNLKATNTYTGTTTVSDGRLNVNGSTHASSNITVDAGKTLGGDGVINGNVTLDGILRAGQGGSTNRNLQIIGTLTASGTSEMKFNIAGETDHDQLIVGSVNLSNTDLSIESFTDSSITELAAGGGLTFLTNGASFYKLIDGTTTGMFANVTEVMDAGELAYYGLTGTQYTTNLFGQEFWVATGSAYLVAIPEPSITLLGSLSLLGLALRRRR